MSSRQQASDENRDGQIRSLVNDYLDKRGWDSSCHDAEFVAAHPSLGPQLGDHLALLREVHAGRHSIADLHDGQTRLDEVLREEHAGRQPTAGLHGGQTRSDEVLRQVHARRQPTDQPSTINRAQTVVIGSTGSSSGLSVRCPYCHEHVELDTGDNWDVVTCRACGSTFEFVGAKNDSNDLQVGSLVGRFQLVQRIGQGGFGSIWKAYDPQLDRTVAVKTPRRGELTAEEVEWFLREARTAAQVKHPNVVATHEVGRDGDRVYIVSDLVIGESLSERLARQRYSMREAVQLILTVARALQAVHNHGVIHRDLKPANILLDQAGVPYLTDFGLARRASGEVTLTLDGQVIGTPAYMSPEQARGDSHQVSHASDVYSLGATLYEMLTGQPPFRGSHHAVFQQLLVDDAVSPRHINPHVSRDLEIVCLKCLEKQPGRRYATAGALASDLHCVQHGLPIAARPVGSIERTIRWARRRPMSAALLGLLMLLGIGGPILAWKGMDMARREADSSRRAVAQTGIATTAMRRETEARKLAETSELEARRLNYSLKIRSVGESGDGAVDHRALDVLEILKPDSGQLDFRSFEWYYWWRASHPPRLATIKVPSAIHEAAISRDLSRVATWHPNNEVWIWDSHANARTLLASNIPHTKLAFFPDGRLLATLTGGRLLRVWDCQSSVNVHQHDFGEPDAVPGCLAIHPDGNGLVVVRPSRITRFDRQADNTFSNAAFAELDSQNAFTSAAWSLDGRRLVAAGERSNSNGVICVWDAESGTLVNRCNTDQVVFSVAISPDGQDVAAVHWNHSVVEWPVKGDALTASVLPQSGARDIRYSPDGNFIIAAYSEHASILDRQTGLIHNIFRDSYQEISFMILSPDATAFAAIPGTAAGHIRLSQIEVPVTRISTHQFPVMSLLFDTTGKKLVSCDAEGTVVATHLADGRKLWRKSLLSVKVRVETLGEHLGKFNSPLKWDLKQPVAMARYGMDQVILLYPDANCQRRDFDSGVLVGNERLVDDFHVGAASFSSDGQRLLLAEGNSPNFPPGSRPYQQLIWNVDERRIEHRFTGNYVGYELVCMSPNGGRWLAALPDRSCAIFDLLDGETLLGWVGLHDYETVCNAAFSPDENWVAIMTDGPQFRLLDLAKKPGNGNAEFRTEANPAHAAAFSPDGKSLAEGTASAEVGDNTPTPDQPAEVRLWDLQTKEIKLVLATAPGYISSLAFSNDGQVLAAGHSNGLIYLWYAASTDEVESFEPAIVSSPSR